MPLKGKIYLFIAVNLEKDLKFPHIVLYPIWREELRCGVDLLEKMSVWLLKILLKYEVI